MASAFHRSDDGLDFAVLTLIAGPPSGSLTTCSAVRPLQPTHVAPLNFASLCVFAFGLGEDLLTEFENFPAKSFQVQTVMCGATVLTNLKSIDGLRCVMNHPLQHWAIHIDFFSDSCLQTQFYGT